MARRWPSAPAAATQVFFATVPTDAVSPRVVVCVVPKLSTATLPKVISSAFTRTDLQKHALLAFLLENMPSLLCGVSLKVAEP